MNFLEITQAVARESGTINNVGPAAVTGQSGRLLKIVDWVRDGWIQIQDERDWSFLRKEFGRGSTPVSYTTAGTARYTGASWSNTPNFGRWLRQAPNGYHPFSLYKSSIGVSDESELDEIDYETWRMRWRRGAQNANRPVEYAISPAGELCLGPVPDDEYVIVGEYWRTPQVLAANADVPLCPARYHRLLVYKALMLLDDHDEAFSVQPRHREEYGRLMEAMERTELPMIRIGGEPVA